MGMAVQLKHKDTWYWLRNQSGEPKEFNDFGEAMDHLKAKNYFEETDCEIIDITPKGDEE